MPERAQSEALGFVLVFSLVVATVGIVSVAGFGTLHDAHQAQRVDNAERAFEVLASNVEDLARGAPSRATEVKLDGAQVETGDAVYVNVSGTATGSDAHFAFNRSVTPVVYRSGEDRVVYAAGAVFREGRGGAAVVREPRLVFGPDRTAIQVIRTHSREGSVGGEGTVLIRTRRSDAELLRANETEYDVTVTITSPRAAAWERTLERPGVSCTRAGNEVACTTTTDAVYVSAVRVDVTLE